MPSPLCTTSSNKAFGDGSYGFTHTADAEAEGDRYCGHYGCYGPGGYVVDVWGAADYRVIIDRLISDGWIDERTQSVAAQLQLAGMGMAQPMLGGRPAMSKKTYMCRKCNVPRKGHICPHGASKDEEVEAAISAVRGFGRWSAHMYMMFSLGRPDIWPSGDLAVRVGFGRIMGWKDRPDEKKVIDEGSAFSPYRSALALLCWQFYSEAPL